MQASHSYSATQHTNGTTHNNGNISQTTATTHKSSSLKSTTYPNAFHKKAPGTLILNDSGITFYPSSNGNANGGGGGVGGGTKRSVPWITIGKHQVSPASHPKHLLKLLLSSNGSAATATATAAPGAPSSVTFQLSARNDLEAIRVDIRDRLVAARRIQAQNGLSSSLSSTARKRRHDSTMFSSTPSPSKIISNGTTSATATTTLGTQSTTTTQEHMSDFTTLTSSALAVTRSCLLSSLPTLKAQHSLLTTPPTATATTSEPTVPEPTSTTTTTLTEEDFWSTHTQSLSNQYSKISGQVTRGISSSISSSLDLFLRGNASQPIQLGVEEMRQIFILYPAVHAAYEAKVPLELSEEQFWRRYLESEYFHRDRGRMGASSMVMGGEGGGVNGGSEAEKAKLAQENARVAAASSNDLFARMELELLKDNGSNKRRHVVKGKHLAVGQFDLTTTANTERGEKLLLRGNDWAPSEMKGVGSRNSRGGSQVVGKKQKVIDKYNRHWAMVLNSSVVTAKCDLKQMAQRSVTKALPGDDDANAGGGRHGEMEELVDQASGDVDGLFRDLDLKNVKAYSGSGSSGEPSSSKASSSNTKAQVRNEYYCKKTLDQIKTLVTPLVDKIESRRSRPTSYRALEPEADSDAPLLNLSSAFPNVTLGRKLLMALTKHMVLDAMTDKDTAKMVNSLPSDFKERYTLYFRRSSELLRHFFALRHVLDLETKNKASNRVGGEDNSTQKLKRIVMGMEGVYREMDGMRKELPQTEVGERMRKMCLLIMEQLDWAFKLHRDGSGTGGGGFVTVED
jgi:transcription initiation factor TFIIH subunit 1